MSQAAERIGVSESEVSRLEAGKRPKMSVETIYKLSVALGQSMEEIRELTRQEEDSPRPSVATAPGRTA